MSELYSALGALLLGAALVPQVWRLARRRSARDFAWSFVLLNLAGLVLLSFRSAELGEPHSSRSTSALRASGSSRSP